MRFKFYGSFYISGQKYDDLVKQIAGTYKTMTYIWFNWKQ